MKKYFLRISKTALVLVYLVIIAGALVRMTGSGMGCPDWPKCFGYYIPPTEISQLTWSENRDFQKGQVIIKDETLLVATKDFKTGQTFDKTNWEKYTKHDYAIFNVYHTWIEYLNRLAGALAGLACLAMAIGSFWYWKTNKKITLFSWLVVFMMGFQAWLGKTVVDSVLSPLKITTHMIVALLIVALILYVIKKCTVSNTNLETNSKFNKLLWLTLCLSIAQIIMGTQVRQHIDNEVKNGVTASVLWLQNPTLIFYIHRSFSLLVLCLNGYLFFQNNKIKSSFSKINWVIVLIVAEILTGIAMFYFDFPFASQPIHLVLASLLFGFQWYLILESRKSKLN
ncbi:COX15/CtaA family protein [Flavobacterium sp. SUN052]|uniref:COX15/CtaA family protein n=1 Tax=Flavobacterium sp. SUN052 TaxID=3002441 RepID=UPI00237EE8CB|nr:COX15/CtaA family protein [Flavobacterium sp. SUN052]MEC4005353.1 COX15/CtaA family protein [Flavobacterium sp. SUN052]